MCSVVTEGLIQQLGNKRTSGDHPNYTIIKTGQKSLVNFGVKNCHNNNNNDDFAEPTDHRVKLKESEKKDKYLPQLCLGIGETREHESDNYTNCNCCSWLNQRSINKGTGGLGNIHLPNPSARAGYDTRSIVLSGV